HNVVVEGQEGSADTKIGHEFFASLLWAIHKRRAIIRSAQQNFDKFWDDYRYGHAIPSEARMNQILRYERAAQKKFDWAYQRLMDLQLRRKENQLSDERPKGSVPRISALRCLPPVFN